MSEEFESDANMPPDGQQAAAEPAGVDPASPDAPAHTEHPAAREETSRTRELSGPSLASVIDVPLRVSVEIGAAKMLVREVLQLNKGSVVPLDRSSGDPADILVNGKRIARGEVTYLDDSLAVRIVELTGREESGGER